MTRKKKVLILGLGVIALVGLGVSLYFSISPRSSVEVFPTTQDYYPSDIGKQEPPIGSPKPSSREDNEPPLLLKNIGVNLDYYDPATNKAGDLTFTKDKLLFGVLFTEYGYTISGEMTSSGQSKQNPQPTFYLPQGSQVTSLVDGVVVDVPKLYSGDFSIMVAPDKTSKWRYETEHVINPLVKPGDRVKAGQVIAQVSPHDNQANSGLGLVEIGILKGGNPPEHVCPFAYLDPSIKDDIFKKLLAFYRSWEDYRANPGLHDEISQKIPGCLKLDPIEG